MHSVGEVGVEVSGLAIHHTIALRLAAKGVRPGVNFAEVCLYLREPNAYSPSVHNGTE
jgi:hypothetical protein